MYDVLLDSRELAQILHISRSYAYWLMRTGALPTRRMGRLVRVRKDDLDQYMRSIGLGAPNYRKLKTHAR